MLTSPIVLNAGTPDEVSMARVNQDNYAAEYRGTDASGAIYFLKIAHELPKNGNPFSSHLVQLRVEHYNSDGEHIRTSSAHTVLKTTRGTQDSTVLKATNSALASFQTGAIIDQVLNFES